MRKGVVIVLLVVAGLIAASFLLLAINFRELVQNPPTDLSKELLIADKDIALTSVVAIAVLFVALLVTLSSIIRSMTRDDVEGLARRIDDLERLQEQKMIGRRTEESKKTRDTAGE